MTRRRFDARPAGLCGSQPGRGREKGVRRIVVGLKKAIYLKYKVAVAKKAEEPKGSLAEAYGVPENTIDMVIKELNRYKGRTNEEMKVLAKKAGVEAAKKKDCKGRKTPSRAKTGSRPKSTN